MQLTINDLINYIKVKKKLFIIIFIISIIINPLKFFLFDQKTSKLTVIIDSYEEISMGHPVQEKINMLLKREIFKVGILDDYVKCQDEQLIICKNKKILNEEFKQKKKVIIEIVEDRYEEILEELKLYAEDIAYFYNTKALQKTNANTLIEHLEKEIITKKYMSIIVSSNQKELKLIQTLTYIILINFLMIGYLILTHPKLNKS